MLSKRIHDSYSCEFDARYSDVIVIIFINYILQKIREISAFQISILSDLLFLKCSLYIIKRDRH